MSRIRRLRRRPDGETGAAAVEMAMVLPVLVLLVFGMVEFGRVFNTQISLTAAAREGARVMALQNDAAAAVQATIDAAPSLSLTAGDVAVNPTPCIAGEPVTVEASSTVDFITSLFIPSYTATGIGVMRCGG